MEYVQERIATLHDLTDPVPDAPTERATVVVPMTAEDRELRAAEGTFATLATVDPAEVIVAVRAPEAEIGRICAWLDSFDLPLTTLWCNAPGVEERLAAVDIDGEAGKGLDVWLALGLVTGEFVAIHDVDVHSYTEARVPRLLAPLERGYDFSKGYYARVEDGQLYGRLFRLLYVPLVEALRASEDEPILEYLASFRYALSGEIGVTAAFARRMRPPRGWGLEVATLGDGFVHAGFEGSAQVDLGVHEHDHRPVEGPGGLVGMSETVTDELCRVIERNGVELDYERVPDRYRTAARRFVRRYAADAAFNGLSYDVDGEREQIEQYARSIRPPGPDGRLPAWEDDPLDPERIREASRVGVSNA